VILALLLALAGAPLDRGDFRYVRPLGNVKPGLVSLELDADALAHSRNLADVRIVDAHDDQVPYVVEEAPPVFVPVPVPPRTREGSSSVYHFTLPYTGRLELATTARVFQRRVSLQRRATWWSSSDPDHAALPLALDCNVTDVDVVIDDGDNAPLPIASAKLVFPGHALRFTAPGGPLTLLYGAAIAPPRYDVELIADRLRAQPAREIHPPPYAPKEPHREKRMFWIAIAVAVVVLLAILGRLLVRT
jgi:hypothetical protein